MYDSTTLLQIPADPAGHFIVATRLAYRGRAVPSGQLAVAWQVPAQLIPRLTAAPSLLLPSFCTRVCTPSVRLPACLDWHNRPPIGLCLCLWFCLWLWHCVRCAHHEDVSTPLTLHPEMWHNPHVFVVWCNVRLHDVLGPGFIFSYPYCASLSRPTTGIFSPCLVWPWGLVES